MKDRRKPTVHINHERWLVSYADFVTLLFAFFVVLYASAQIDKQKAIRLSGAIEEAFQELGVARYDQRPHLATSLDTHADLPAVPPASSTQPAELRPPEDFTAIRGELEKALAPEIKRNEVALHLEPDGLVVSLREMGFFDSGSATIKPGAENAIARVAGILLEHSCPVRIEGHTDDVPIHTTQFASNWELSTARATGLVRSLIESYGVPPARLAAAGYAEFHPAGENDTAKGRQVNRRVDLVIMATPFGNRAGRAPVVPLGKAPDNSGEQSESHPTGDSGSAAPSSQQNPG